MSVPGALSNGRGGLTGLVGFQLKPEATAEQRNGSPADPRHANPGEQATPYPWDKYPGQPHGPYGLENGLLGMPMASFTQPAGYLAQDPTADEQPQTRAAPWPKGTPSTVTPDGLQDRHEQTAAIRGTGMGLSRKFSLDPTLNPVQDEWVEVRENRPGDSLQAAIPQQISGSGSAGWGTRDRAQSEAPQNEYGFDTAHMHRRYAAGSIPGNNLWMQPGGRLVHKSIAGTALVPNGQDTPFQGQNPGDNFNTQGAILTDLPVSYDSPPDPAVAPSYPTDGTGQLSYNYLGF